MHERDQNKSAGNLTEYKNLRNKCVSLVREANKTYYQSCIKNCNGDSTKLWKHIHDLVPGTSKSAPIAIKDGDTTLTDAQRICESFNNHFSTIFLKTNQTPDLEIIHNFVSRKIPDDIHITIPPFKCDEVFQSLIELDPHIATGLDGLSSQMLKMSASVMAKPLTVIFNQSIACGYFPTRWKTARVTPIHKSGSRTDKNNYRPISILCIVSKLLERHHNKITSYLRSYNLLYRGQSGFRRHHSCESAIVKLVDTWLTNIEHGKLNGVTLIDFRKAFDMINVDFLISKLKCYRFDETLITWIHSYLTGRYQYVQIRNNTSSLAPVSLGVPQGIILGPLLFILFFNDLPLHSNQNLDLYADDSTLHSSSNSINKLNDTLCSAMNTIEQWSISNGMVVNTKKTKSMVICTYQKLAKMDTSALCVKHKNIVLENVISEKLLDVTIDNHLSWKAHTDDLASSLSKLIALFRRIKIYLPLEIRILFYKTFFQSRIDFCCTVWGQSPHVSRIYKLQKLLLRLIYDKSKFSPSKRLFEQSNILPIKYRIMYRIVCLVYKSLNRMTRDYLTDKFKPLSMVSQRQTRSTANMELWVPNYKRSISRCLPVG